MASIAQQHTERLVSVNYEKSELNFPSGTTMFNVLDKICIENDINSTKTILHVLDAANNAVLFSPKSRIGDVTKLVANPVTLKVVQEVEKDQVINAVNETVSVLVQFKDRGQTRQLDFNQDTTVGELRNRTHDKFTKIADEVGAVHELKFYNPTDLYTELPDNIEMREFAEWSNIVVRSIIQSPELIQIDSPVGTSTVKRPKRKSILYRLRRSVAQVTNALRVSKKMQKAKESPSGPALTSSPNEKIQLKKSQSLRANMVQQYGAVQVLPIKPKAPPAPCVRLRSVPEPVNDSKEPGDVVIQHNQSGTLPTMERAGARRVPTDAEDAHVVIKTKSASLVLPKESGDANYCSLAMVTPQKKRSDVDGDENYGTLAMVTPQLKRTEDAKPNKVFGRPPTPRMGFHNNRLSCREINAAGDRQMRYGSIAGSMDSKQFSKLSASAQSIATTDGNASRSRAITDAVSAAESTPATQVRSEHLTPLSGRNVSMLKISNSDSGRLSSIQPETAEMKSRDFDDFDEEFRNTNDPRSIETLTRVTPMTDFTITPSSRSQRRGSSFVSLKKARASTDQILEVAEDFDNDGHVTPMTSPTKSPLETELDGDISSAPEDLELPLGSEASSLSRDVTGVELNDSAFAVADTLDIDGRQDIADSEIPSRFGSEMMSPTTSVAAVYAAGISDSASFAIADCKRRLSQSDDVLKTAYDDAIGEAAMPRAESTLAPTVTPLLPVFNDDSR